MQGPGRGTVVLLSVLLLATGCVAPEEVPERQPTPAPPPPALEWTASQRSSYLDDVRGLTVQRLTTDPADDDVFYQEPRSFGGAAGDLFLFRSDRSGLYRLLLANLTTGETATLLEDPSFGWSPTWSPGGQEVLIGNEGRLRFVNATTGILREVSLPTRDWVSFPHVSPDGTRVLFSEESRDEKGEAVHQRLAMVGVDGGSYRVMFELDHAVEQFLDHPVWLDDGRVVVLTRGADRDFGGAFNRPYVIDVETGNRTRLPRDCSHYDPNPTRPWIVCGQEGYVLDAEGTKVFEYSGIHGHASWAPEGDRFLATADPVPVPAGQPHHGTIVTIDVASGKVTDLVRHQSTYDSVAHRQPDAQWSPDGRWIVWTADPDGNQDLFALPLTQGL